MKAGEYRLTPGMTPPSLLRASGVRAGRAAQADAGGGVDRPSTSCGRSGPSRPWSKTLQATSATDLARELDLPWPSAEGAFLPETYLFARGESDRELLSRAHAALKERLEQAWEARQPGLPLASPYELLTLASIVERETALASERPLIAGVFIRRLRSGMRLQTDPTVIYGLGSRFDGNLTRARPGNGFALEYLHARLACRQRRSRRPAARPSMPRQDRPTARPCSSWPPEKAMAATGLAIRSGSTRRRCVTTWPR